MTLTQFRPDGSVDPDATKKFVAASTSIEELLATAVEVEKLRVLGRCSLGDAIQLGASTAMRQIDLSMQHLKIAQESFKKIFRR